MHASCHSLGCPDAALAEVDGVGLGAKGVRCSGKALAARLLERGASVSLVARNGEKLEVVPGRNARFATAMARLFPGLARKVVDRALSRLRSPG